MITHHLQSAIQEAVLRGFNQEFKTVYQLQVLDNPNVTVPLPVFGSGDPHLVPHPVHFIVTTNHPVKYVPVAHMAHLTFAADNVFVRFDLDGHLYTLRADLHSTESELTVYPKQKLHLPKISKEATAPLTVELIDLGYVF